MRLLFILSLIVPLLPASLACDAEDEGADGSAGAPTSVDDTTTAAPPSADTSAIGDHGMVASLQLRSLGEAHIGSSAGGMTEGARLHLYGDSEGPLIAIPDGAKDVDTRLRSAMGRDERALKEQIKRLKEKLDDSHIQNRPEIPGRKEVVIPGMELAQPEVFPNTAERLPAGYRRELLERLVVFVDSRPQPGAGSVVGQGVLVSSNCVLTARHVADHIEKDLASAASGAVPILTTLVGPPGQRRPLQPQSVKKLSDGEDPDIALVKVAPIDSVGPSLVPPAGNAIPELKRSIFLIGGMKYNPEPYLSTGIVTTSFGQHDVRGSRTKLTMGTNCVSYSGQSGSPVFDGLTGELLGIYVAGIKGFIPAGDRVIPAPANENDWDTFPDWSWIVPLAPFANDLNTLIAQSENE